MGSLFPAEASWLEIDATALAHNAGVFREVLGAGVRLGGVLKGNAYGHGFAEVLPLAHAACDALYVIEARDALAIRAFEGRSSAPRREVLVLGAVDADEAVELARAQVDLALTDSGQARFVPALRAAGVRLRGHVHVDTGLGREGFSVDELLPALSWMGQARDAIEVAGVLSHFANTEDVTEQSYAGQQLSAFDEGARRVRAAVGAGSLERHIAASAAALLLPQARHDAVRIGISLYGLWASSETRLSARALLGRDGDEQVSADQLAVWAQTINYEIVTRIGAHLRRIVI